MNSQYVKLFTTSPNCNRSIVLDHNVMPGNNVVLGNNNATGQRESPRVRTPASTCGDPRRCFVLKLTAAHSPTTISSNMRNASIHHVHLHHGPTGRGEVARVKMTA